MIDDTGNLPPSFLSPSCPSLRPSTVMSLVLIVHREAAGSLHVSRTCSPQALHSERHRSPMTTSGQSQAFGHGLIIRRIPFLVPPPPPAMPFLSDSSLVLTSVESPTRSAPIHPTHPSYLCTSRLQQANIWIFADVR